MMSRTVLGVTWWHRGLMAAAAAVSLSACASAPDDGPPAADPLTPQPERVVQPFDEQARRGSARDRTLYPHHFRAGSAELTDLGRETVAVVAQQSPADGARLQLSPGAAEGELGNRRVQAVAQQLRTLGVAPERVVVTVGHPGGDGAATIDVLSRRAAIAEEPMRPPTPITTPSSGRKP